MQQRVVTADAGHSCRIIKEKRVRRCEADPQALPFPLDHALFVRDAELDQFVMGIFAKQIDTEGFISPSTQDDGRFWAAGANGETHLSQLQRLFDTPQ